MAGTTDVTGRNATTGNPELTKSTGNGLWSYLSALIAGESNQASATNAYLKTYTPGKTLLLSGTSAVTIGASAAANDTMLLQVTILANGGAAATATIVGMADQTNAAQNILLTGSTSVDVVYAWPCGLVNGKGLLQITPSVTLKVLVSYNPV